MYLAVTLPTWIEEVLAVLTQAFTTFAQGLLTLVKNGFIWLFCEYTESGGVYTVTGLSTFAIYSFLLMSIAIVMALTAFITNLVRRSR